LVGGALVVAHAALVVAQVPGSRERRVGEKQDGYRAEQHAAAARAVHARSGTAGCCTCGVAVGHASRLRSAVLSARMWFSICGRYVPAGSIEGMRVLIVEDEPYLAEAIRDGLRL